MDAVSGGIFRLTPEQVTADLYSLALVQDGEGALITVVLQSKAEWEQIGQLEILN